MTTGAIGVPKERGRGAVHVFVAAPSGSDSNPIVDVAPTRPLIAVLFNTSLSRPAVEPSGPQGHPSAEAHLVESWESPWAIKSTLE